MYITGVFNTVIQYLDSNSLTAHLHSLKTVILGQGFWAAEEISIRENVPLSAHVDDKSSSSACYMNELNLSLKGRVTTLQVGSGGICIQRQIVGESTEALGHR